MSDPRSRDPRLDPPPLHEDDVRYGRSNQVTTSAAVWGWVAGAVVLALVLIFVFTRNESADRSTATLPPPASTTAAPPAATQNPATPPSTTGQGTGQNQR